MILFNVDPYDDTKYDLYHNDIISLPRVLIIRRSHKASSKSIYIYTHYDILNNQIAALCFVYKTEEIVRNSILRFFFQSSYCSDNMAQQNDFEK